MKRYISLVLVIVYMLNVLFFLSFGKDMGIAVFLGTSMVIPVMAGVIFSVVNFENFNTLNILQVGLTSFVSSFVPYMLSVMYSEQLLAILNDETINQEYATFIQNYTSDIKSYLFVWLFVFIFSMICATVKVSLRSY